MEIELSKDRFKFAAAHFTIFDAKRAERLHGHNYQVLCLLKFQESSQAEGLLYELKELKDILQRECEAWDEFVLLPTRSPHLDLKVSERQVEARYGEKFYSFPREDVLLLDVQNISLEVLARTWVDNLFAEYSRLKGFLSLRLRLQETKGQAVWLDAART